MKFLNCCANLGFLFKETAGILNRFKLAQQAGFRAVEYPFPLDEELAVIAAAQTECQLKTILMNCFLDDSNFGMAAIPGQENKFLQSINRSIKYCLYLGCDKLHVMAGLVHEPTTEHDDVYESNIKLAVSLCYQHRITVLIEPINKISLPNYYMNSFDKAIALIKKINNPFLKLQLDIYHLQLIQGNLTNNIKEWLPWIGHVQVAQVPYRNEPNTPGEVDFKYIFSVLRDLGYDKWIGFEYQPKEQTSEGLTFLTEFGLKIDSEEDPMGGSG